MPNMSLSIYCNIVLQHTATHCNTLQHTATHGNTQQHTATHCNTLQHTATPQHRPTHCNTLRRRNTDEGVVAEIEEFVRIRRRSSHKRLQDNLAQQISRSTSLVARNGASYVTWLTFMCICEVIHIHVWRDSFMCVTVAQHISRSTSWVARNGVSYVTWHTFICDMTHSCVWLQLN